jgi:catechol 2,3-dioxygenase-like lactoylglutathione lyase family enzyme
VFSKNNALTLPPTGVLASVVTDKLQDSINAYKSILGYKLIQTSTVSQDFADHWGEPRIANQKSAILGPASGAEIYIRLLEVTDAGPAAAGAGWFALELCVQDVEAVYEQVSKDNIFKPFAKPAPLSFTDKVYPMQCRREDGEIIYFNQTSGNLPDVDLPIANSPVDHLFITILTASNLEQSIEFYAQALGMDIQENHEIAYKTLNRVFELPLDKTHKLSTLGRDRRVTLEINQCPVSKPAQDTLRKGIWMMSFSVDSIREELQPIATGAGYRSAVITGPDNEKIELIAV